MKYLHSSVLHGWILGPVIFMSGLGIHSAYRSINHALKYTEVQAIVTDVRAVCTFSDPETVVKWRPCEELSGLPEQQVRKRHMLRQYVITVSFQSPADGKLHQGTFKDFGHDVTDGTSLVRPGQTGMICANDDDPSLYHYDAWPFSAARALL